MADTLVFIMVIKTMVNYFFFLGIKTQFLIINILILALNKILMAKFMAWLVKKEIFISVCSNYEIFLHN